AICTIDCCMKSWRPIPSSGATPCSILWRKKTRSSYLIPLMIISDTRTSCYTTGWETRMDFLHKIAFVIMACLLSAVAQAQILKIATVVPEGSAWMKSMPEGAAEIKQRTTGRVELKIYGGGVQGNDKQVQRKMRTGQLHGGAFTSGAMSNF